MTATSMTYQGKRVTVERNAANGDLGFNTSKPAPGASPAPTDQVLITIHGPGDTRSVKVVSRSELTA